MNTLQTLLAFSALHEQVDQRKATENCHATDTNEISANSQFNRKQFVLNEVLELVAKRALAITGADGLVIALAENEEIVSRAVAGTIRPDVGIAIDRDSGFSGGCFSSAQIWRCDETETDARVNLQACRDLGVRSIVAVPLRGRQHAIGLLEAFSVESFGFKDRDVLHLRALANLVVGAMNPEEEERFTASAQLAATKLEVHSPAPESASVSLVPREDDHLEAASATSILANPLRIEVEFPTTTMHEPSLAPEKILSDFGPAAATQMGTAAATVAEQPDVVVPRGSRKLLICIVLSLVFGTVAWLGIRARSRGRTTSDPDHGTNLSIRPPMPPSHMFARVTGLRHVATADSISVVVDVDNQVQYDAQRLFAPDRIYFDLRDTTLASDVAAKTVEVHDPLLTAFRVSQPAFGITRVVLVTKVRTDFTVRLEPSPSRLVIALPRIGTMN